MYENDSQKDSGIELNFQANSVLNDRGESPNRGKILVSAQSPQIAAHRNS